MTLHQTPTSAGDLGGETTAILAAFGIAPETLRGGDLTVRSPLTGETLAHLPTAGAQAARDAVEVAQAAFLQWRVVPAPKRGELVRLLGEELRTHKAALGRLVSIEVGKVPSEGLGEVQEMIDICDFAVGLSRQLYGLTIATERGEHRMMESWHPLG
ncbi:MAG: aldehyde dehydrogenase family protein, partial [Methylobacterium sp.]